MSVSEVLSKIKTPSTGGGLNIPVKITFWGEDFVNGTRIDTGENVKVMLNNQNIQTKGEYGRPTLSELKTKQRCTNGAVLCFDNSKLHSDGVWYSRWANVVSKGDHDTLTSVAVVMSSSYAGKSTNGKPYIVTRMINASLEDSPEKRIKITDQNSINSLIRNHFKVNPAAESGVLPFINIIGIDSTGEISIEVNITINEHVNTDMIKIKTPEINPEVSINKFWESNEGAAVNQLLNTENVDIFAFTGKKCMVGTATAKKLLQNNDNIGGGVFENSFKINHDAHYEFDNVGYKKCIIAVRTDQFLNSKFVCFIKPIDQFNKAHNITDLK